MRVFVYSLFESREFLFPDDVSIDDVKKETKRFFPGGVGFFVVDGDRVVKEGRL